MMKPRQSEEGYLLVGMLVVIFILMLSFTIAAPTVLKSLQRDKELESMHRGQQYERAIQVFYRKMGHYPGSIEQLESTNNMRFLRRRYKDPLTGKDDWRIIHVGESKSQIKGFFGQPLAPAGGGLGTAAGMSSGIGAAPTAPNGAMGGFGAPGSPIGAPGSPIGGPGSPIGSPLGAPTGATGDSGASGSTGSTGATGTSGFGNPLGTLNASGTGNGAPIVGVGTSKKGASLIAVNGDENTYEKWEFVYDPRIEQMRAQTSLLGGSVSSTPASNMGSGFPGSSTGLPGGGAGFPGTSGPGAPASPSPTTPTTPTSPTPTNP